MKSKSMVDSMRSKKEAFDKKVDAREIVSSQSMVLEHSKRVDEKGVARAISRLRNGKLARFETPLRENAEDYLDEAGSGKVRLVGIPDLKGVNPGEETIDDSGKPPSLIDCDRARKYWTAVK